MNLIQLIKRAILENPPPPIRINLTKGEQTMAPTQINLTDPIKYSINEAVKLDVNPPVNFTNLSIEVDRYAGGGHEPMTIEGVAASAYTTITNTLNGTAALIDMPIKWPLGTALKVYPFAGEGLNAYYNRKHLAFFYAQNKQTKEWFFTSASPDIVCHELGHALLDSWRPDLWDAASLEIWAFHEAFGDIVAMLSLMQYPEVIEQILQQTGGDLRKHNVASDIAENFSKILAANGYESADGYLRSGINSYVYKDPQFLPNTGKEGELTKEPHSLSRVFFGAIYDVLVMMYEDLVLTRPPNVALSEARDLLTMYVGKAIKNAPASVRFFESMAKTMLWVDFSADKKYHDRMQQIFSNRKIINYEFSALALGDLSGVITDHGDGMMTICRSKHDKLCNCSKRLRAQSHSHDSLENVELSMVCTEAYIHDNQGRLIDVHRVTEGQAVLAAEDMVDYLKRNNAVSDDPSTPFEISNGRLKRTLICCCSGGKKPLPSSPEFYKQYKPENNAGCCGGCKSADKEVKKRKIKRGCFVRYKVNG